MGIIIGSARIDENGNISGGAAGDQTGNEVATQAYYVHKKGWLAFRPKAIAVANAIADSMLQACQNDNIGYDQGNRADVITQLKKYGSMAKIAVKTESDCSSLVRGCCIQAGFDPGDFNTASEPATLKKTGMFEDAISVTSSTVLYNGDILVTNGKGHTVVVVSGNQRVAADSGKGTTYKIGDIVSFTGTKHYTSADAASGKTCKPGTAKVTNVYAKGKHPYHLQAVSGGGSTVYGWVDLADIGAATTSNSDSFAVGDKVKVTGTIYGNGNGSGGSIKKNGATMYVSDIVDSKTYPYYIGVAAKKGGGRIGWAKPDIVKKQ
jgi:hypothetical protein